MRSVLTLGALLGLIVATALTGCRGPQPIPQRLPAPVQVQPAPVSYAQVVERYNAHVAPLDQLWSSAVAQLRWRDEEGRSRFEQGEGNLIFARPGRMAFTVGKLGKPLIWAGSDEARYWLIDLQDDGVAYVGRHRFAGQPCAEPLPLPLNPRDVLHLLGLLPLESTPPSPPAVGLVADFYLIEPPGLNLRMLVEPATGQPVRVDLLDADGRSVLVSRLSNPEAVEVEGLPPGSWPRIATQAHIEALDQEGQVTISLTNLSDGRRFDRLNPRVFDLDALLARFKPAQIRLLDEGCN